MLVEVVVVQVVQDNRQQILHITVQAVEEGFLGSLVKVDTMPVEAVAEAAVATQTAEWAV